MLTFRPARINACVVRGRVVSCLLMAGMVLGVAAARVRAGDPPALTAEQVQANWDSDWALYCSRYILLDGEYYTCPKYTPDFPSSRHVSVEGVMADNAHNVSVSQAGMTVTRNVPPTVEDAQAKASALPRVELGEYGHVAGGDVAMILGPEEMIVRNLQVIDATELKKQEDTERARLGGTNNQAAAQTVKDEFRIREEVAKNQSDESFRTPLLVRGVTTGGLQVRSRWRGNDDKGIALAVVGPMTVNIKTSASGTKTREYTYMTAVPAELFRNGRLTKEQFVDMLDKRGLTLEQFIGFVVEEKRKGQEGLIERVIRRVEAMRNASLDAGPATTKPGEKPVDRTYHKTPAAGKAGEGQ